jgi:hypothetical protein
MFEATVNNSFTLPDGGAGRQYLKGQPLTNWEEIRLILGSEFRYNITKLSPGTHIVSQPEPAPEPAPVQAPKARKDSDKDA